MEQAKSRITHTVRTFVFINPIYTYGLAHIACMHTWIRCMCFGTREQQFSRGFALQSSHFALSVSLSLSLLISPHSGRFKCYTRKGHFVIIIPTTSNIEASNTSIRSNEKKATQTIVKRRIGKRRIQTFVVLTGVWSLCFICAGESKHTNLSIETKPHDLYDKKTPIFQKKPKLFRVWSKEQNRNQLKRFESNKMIDEEVDLHRHTYNEFDVWVLCAWVSFFLSRFLCHGKGVAFVVVVKTAAHIQKFGENRLNETKP